MATEFQLPEFHLPKLPSRRLGWATLRERIMWADCMLLQQARALNNELAEIPHRKLIPVVVARLRIHRKLTRIARMREQLNRYAVALTGETAMVEPVNTPPWR